jgi:hypothetical protein
VIENIDDLDKQYEYWRASLNWWGEQSYYANLYENKDDLPIISVAIDGCIEQLRKIRQRISDKEIFYSLSPDERWELIKSISQD